MSGHLSGVLAICPQSFD